MFNPSSMNSVARHLGYPKPVVPGIQPRITVKSIGDEYHFYFYQFGDLAAELHVAFYEEPVLVYEEYHTTAEFDPPFYRDKAIRISAMMEE